MSYDLGGRSPQKLNDVSDWMGFVYIASFDGVENNTNHKMGYVTSKGRLVERDKELKRDIQASIIHVWPIPSPRRIELEIFSALRFFIHSQVGLKYSGEIILDIPLKTLKKIVSMVVLKYLLKWGFAKGNEILKDYFNLPYIKFIDGDVEYVHNDRKPRSLSDLAEGDEITVIWKSVKDSKNKAWKGEHFKATVGKTVKDGVEIEFTDGSEGKVVERDDSNHIPLEWVLLGSEKDRKLDKSRILDVDGLYAQLPKDSGIVVASLNALAYLKF